MKIRYVGDADGVDLALSSACIPCPKGQWVDIAVACAEAMVPAHHVEIAVRSLVGSPVWEVQGVAGAGEPAQSASKGTWVAYAVAQGWSEKDAKALPKPDLIAALQQPAEPEGGPVDDDVEDEPDPAGLESDDGDEPSDPQE